MFRRRADSSDAHAGRASRYQHIAAASLVSAPTVGGTATASTATGYAPASPATPVIRDIEPESVDGHAAPGASSPSTLAADPIDATQTIPVEHAALTGAGASSVPPTARPVPLIVERPRDPGPIVNPGLAALVERSLRPALPDEAPPANEPANEPADASPATALPTIHITPADEPATAPAPTAAAPTAAAPTAPTPVDAPAPAKGHPMLFWIAMVAFWLAALPAGFACAVAAGGRRVSPCSKNVTTLGCTTSGSVLSIAMLLAVIAVVGTATVYAFDLRRRPRRWAGVLGGGVVALVLLATAAWLIIRSIR